MKTNGFCLGAVLALALCLVLFASPVLGAENITSGVGSYYIMWNWNGSVFGSDTVVSVDGSVVDLGDNVTFYILSNLNPGETHRIDIYNKTSFVFESSVNTTLKSLHQIFLIIGLVLVLMFCGQAYPYITLLAVVLMSYIMREVITLDYDSMYLILISFLFIVAIAVFGEQFRRRYLRGGKLKK